jgi:hypothetical protein
MWTTAGRAGLALLRGAVLAMVALGLGMIGLNLLDAALVRPAAELLLFGLTPVAFLAGLAGVPGRWRPLQRGGC